MKKAIKIILDGFQGQAINIVPYEDIKDEITQLFEI